MKKAVTALGTRRLDGRSAIAVAVKRWKADVTRDLGGDLSRAQETILEASAQAWVILSSLDDYIARQPSLVTRKRQLLPVVMQRMQIADSLAKNLERLGLERRSRPVPDLGQYLEQRTLSPTEGSTSSSTGNIGNTAQKPQSPSGEIVFPVEAPTDHGAGNIGNGGVATSAPVADVPPFASGEAVE